MQERFKGMVSESGTPITCNADMDASHIRKFCQLDEASSRLLENAFNALGLSARGHDRILRLARTIADLEGSENIKPNHIAEAIQLRTLDKKYF